MFPDFDEAAAVVPLELLLARSSVAAVTVGSATVHRDGFALDVVVRVREEVRPVSERIDDRDWFATDRRAGVPEGRLFRFGVRFPDGTTVTSLDGVQGWERRSDDVPMLVLTVSRGFEEAGRGRLFRLDYRVLPLPPEGELTLACEWPEMGSR
ncbi:MAG TPA: hypothetical protein VIA06_15070 [Candidatus Dormibacteraeota bacterium]|nr:hypothetical protein [Candidatus Dormibacteraeota bacterium]